MIHTSELWAPGAVRYRRVQGQKPTPKRSSGPWKIGFRCTRLAYSAMTCPAASFCRKSSHGHKVRGHRRGLRPQKPGCAFFDPQDTMHSEARREPAGTPRALVRSASAAPRQTQRTTCMHPYEPSAPPVGTCRVVASAYALSHVAPSTLPSKNCPRDSFPHELVIDYFFCSWSRSTLAGRRGIVSIVAPGDPTCNRVRWAAVRNCHTMMPVPVGPRRAPTHPVPPAPPAPAIVPAEIWYLLNFVHGKWKRQFPTSIVASVVSYNLRQDFSQKTLPLFLCGLPGSLFWAQKSSKSSGEDRI